MHFTSRLRTFFSLTIILVFFLTACGAAATPAPEQSTGASEKLTGSITISGAFALYPMMQRWVEEFNKVNPDVIFDVSAGGAGKGMSDALAGAVEIGMVSRAITPEEEEKGAFWVPVVKDAVFPMVSAQNPVIDDLLKKGLTKEKFIGIFITGEITTWGQAVDRADITDEIHVYTRSDACGAAEVWAAYLGGKKQDNLLGIGISSDPGLLDAVIKDPFGIGYNNLNYAFDSATGKPVAGSTAVPIDANSSQQAETDELLDTKAKAVEAVASGKYPAPPARPLNLVTKGKPTGITQAFLEWILADGQKFVGEAGYVELTKDQIDTANQKIR